MKIVVPKEDKPGERRVALIPESVKRLRQKGIELSVEAGAGERAWFSDQEYQEAGAAIENSGEQLFGAADLVLKIHAPSPREVELLRPGSALICHIYPRVNPDLVKLLAENRITAIAVDSIPRTTLAHAM